jgi:putative ABC transport system permease protein
MPRLLVLSIAVGMVLLIGCANLAGLLLARGSARQPELAVRAALGASRGRLVCQLLSESVILALAAGMISVALTFWLQRLVPLVTGLTEPGFTPVVVEWPSLLFALGLSALTGVLFGIAPAIRASSNRLNQVLVAGGRTTDGKFGTTLRSSLVVAQVAVSVVLLIGAGLLIRSLTRLVGTNPGFEVQHLLTGEIELLPSEFPQGARRIQFFDGLRQDLVGIPGVNGVGFVNLLPIRNTLGDLPVWTPDRPPDSLVGRSLSHFRVVLPGYFDALRIPLLSGRDLERPAGENAPRTLVINELMSRTLFPDRNALGQQVLVDMGQAAPVSFEVVGVVGSARIEALAKDAPMTMYASFYQFPDYTLRFAIRTGQDPESIGQTVRRLVSARGSDIPADNLVSMEHLIGDSLAPQRVTAITLTLFSVVAVLLACIGLYGVLANSVAQRTHEIGVRVALGAEPEDVLLLVVRQGAVLALAGAVVGSGVAYWLTRLLANQLYGVTPTDPLTFASVVLLLLTVALLACYLPAHRAACLDPMAALRCE